METVSFRPAGEPELAGAIRGHSALVGIVGLGYVGLPLALTFIEKGFTVLGFDVDPTKVDALGRARATSSTSTAAGCPRRSPRGASRPAQTSRGSESRTPS